MPETKRPNQSQVTSPRSPTVQELLLHEKGGEERKEEEELQRLMLKLKDALSLQGQPGENPQRHLGH